MHWIGWKTTRGYVTRLMYIMSWRFLIFSTAGWSIRAPCITGRQRCFWTGTLICRHGWNAVMLSLTKRPTCGLVITSRWGGLMTCGWKRCLPVSCRTRLWPSYTRRWIIVWISFWIITSRHCGRTGRRGRTRFCRSWIIWRMRGLCTGILFTTRPRSWCVCWNGRFPNGGYRSGCKGIFADGLILMRIGTSWSNCWKVQRDRICRLGTRYG